MRGIESIVFGLVVLRRRVTGQPWFRTIDAGAGTTGFGGAQLLQAIEGLDFVIDSGAGPRLLDERLVLVEGHVLTHRMAFQGGEYRRPAVTLWHRPGDRPPGGDRPERRGRSSRSWTGNARSRR